MVRGIVVLFQNSNLVTIFKDNDHLLIEEKNIMDIKDTLDSDVISFYNKEDETTTIRPIKKRVC